MVEPIVTVSTGTLRGTTASNLDHNVFYSFQGIPYAKPPLGPLRFKDPEPAEPWSGVRDATEEGEQCLCRHDLDKTLLRGGEDCLFLNVYTPELPNASKKSALKPVLFWIHGGGFTSGSGSTEVYGPQFLLTEDVVLVTVNYRTGFLGFLSMEDPSLEVPGNAGLKDMVMALKWVQKNIVHFSGDPRNVTIFGESAGAASCHFLILSPMGKGLFHRAILQSGCALNVWAISKPYVFELAKLLNLEATTEREILAELRQMDLERIYRAAEKVPDLFLASRQRPHGPVIEKNPEGAFLCQDPVEIIKSGRYNHVPIMIGYTTREGMLSEILQKPAPFKPIKDFTLAVPYFLNIPKGTYLDQQIAHRIKEFYYGDEEPSLENKDNFYLMETDNFFLRELIRTTKYHLQTSKQPVYLYRFALVTTLNILKNLYSMSEHGACHGDDLGYVFKNILTPNIIKGSNEDIGIRRIVKLWTTFARNGDPNPKKEDPLINVKWEKVTNKKINYLNIGENLTVGKDPEAHRMHFWEEIFSISIPQSKL